MTRIRAPLPIHFAANDPRIDGTWPAYEAALKAAGRTCEAHFHPGTLHGFHNGAAAPPRSPPRVHVGEPGPSSSHRAGAERPGG